MRRELLARLEVVHLYVPGLPVERLVVVDDQLSCFLALGDQLSLGVEVVERSDGAICDLDGELRVAQLKDTGAGLSDRSRGCGVGRGKRAHRHCTQRFAVRKAILLRVGCWKPNYLAALPGQSVDGAKAAVRGERFRVVEAKLGKRLRQKPLACSKHFGVDLQTSASS